MTITFRSNEYGKVLSESQKNAENFSLNQIGSLGQNLLDSCAFVHYAWQVRAVCEICSHKLDIHVKAGKYLVSILSK